MLFRDATLGLLATLLALSASSFFVPSAFASSANQAWTISGPDFSNGTFQNTTVANQLLQLGPRSLPGNRALVLDVGPPGSADSLYARDSFVLKDTDGTYKMWYSGQDGSRNRMMYATSSDGFHWTKYGVIIDVLTPPYDFDSIGSTMSVVKIGSTYHGWFQGAFWGGPYGLWGQIYHAVSTDGANWTITGVALPPNQAWDNGLVDKPMVLLDSHGVFWMCFMGWDGSRVRLGMATSLNGTWFVPHPNNPVLPLGSSGAWDSMNMPGASVALNGSTWTMWYQGSDGVEDRIGLAHSADGFNWTKDPSNPVIAPDSSSWWDDAGVGFPDSLVDGASSRLYFTGSDGTYARIGVFNFTPQSNVTYSGSYTSAVFDSALAGTTWASLAAQATAPTGTTFELRARAGNVSSPDITWSPWASASALATLPRTRYAQVAVNLTSTAWNLTPTVTSVTLDYAPNGAPSAIPWAPSASGWSSVDRPVLRWNATDPEGDAIVSERVQVSSAADFSAILADSGNLTPGTTNWQLPFGLADGTWYWRVRAEDVYGAWGAWQSSLLRIDTVPPVLTVSSPAPGQLLHVNSLSVIWNTMDALSGIDRVRVSVDGGAALSVGAGNSSMVLSVLPDGPHTITVTAFDLAGNSQSVAIPVTIDTTAPKLTITSPASGTLIHVNSVDLSWTATDSTSGIDHVTVSVDNGVPTTYSAGATTTHLTGLADGAHTVTVTAFDRAGNSATVTVSLSVDTGVLSVNGPYGAWPLAGVVVLVVVAAGLVVFLRFRRRRRQFPGEPKA